MRMVNESKQNAQDLERELEWFTQVLDIRLRNYFGEEKSAETGMERPPDLSGSKSYYAQFVQHYELTNAERISLLLSLIPHVRPQLLDVLFCKNETTGRGFTEFGGIQGATHSGFLPTAETAAFIIAGDDMTKRFEVLAMFDGDHFFARHNILQLSLVNNGEPLLSATLNISREYLYLFTSGVERKPNFNTEFPARLIETKMEWNDLILPLHTIEQLDEIRHWILHGKTLMTDWEMDKKLQPGFTSLFYGASGTGKTLSACLIGKHCGCDVYKVDLSMIVSKYIGETEKNLARIFDMAEHKSWILFFDEADALFGKRTKVEDAHDRYANQEVSYLLQRIEEFSGVTILASNIKTNIDDAFLRRFHSVVHFPTPKPAERLRLWKNAFSPKAQLRDDVDLGKIAEKYDLTGGTIMNVVRYSSLKALSRNEQVIRAEDLEEGIRREYLKEGRTV
jgi:hypothetical protein